MKFPVNPPLPRQQPGGSGQTPIEGMDNNHLVRDCFLKSSWGLKDQNNMQHVMRLEEEAHKRFARFPDLIDKVRHAKSDGELAHTLSAELITRFRRSESTKNLEEWLQESPKNRAHDEERVIRSLRISLEKERAFQERKKSITARGNGKSSLAQITFAKEGHPNAIRNISPASRWSILIDESGSNFSSPDLSGEKSDGKIGRFVAIILPEDVSLPPIKPDFHANKEDDSELDKTLGILLNAKVGIFGFTVGDSELSRDGWFDHLPHFARWILVQLPFATKTPLQVDFYIENRGTFTTSFNLSAMAETLAGDLRSLDKNKFSQLTVNVQFVGKNHPLIGYADTVAFTWASTMPSSKDRMRKSAMRGHCLLNVGKDNGTMERLYLTLNAQQKLQPGDWYQLCGASCREPAGGLLAHFLSRIGNRTRKFPEIWRQYLNEVRYRLQTKQYQLDELAGALDWLETHAPPGEALPKKLQLPLEAASLALANHLGKTGRPSLQSCMDLMASLHDEAAPDVCEMALRITTRATNEFDFVSHTDMIDRWLKEPIAVPGLLNHGKLHSIRGQLAAFRSHYDEAIAHFDTALSTFDRLSDPLQAEREKAQTALYRLVAQMDSTQVTTTEIPTAILRYLNDGMVPDELHVAQRMAAAGHALRYQHHLFLRATAHYPDALASARRCYLNQQDDWQIGDNHPWPLIYAYRAWLLADEKCMPEAERWMAMAIDGCETADDRATMLWMGAVFRALSKSLGLLLDSSCQPNITQQQQFRSLIPGAPTDALTQLATATLPATRKDILTGLQTCLPYIFH